MDLQAVDKLRKVENLKMLVADDEPAVLDNLRKIGEMMNFEVHAAKDGKEAWEVFSSVKPDVVISDIYMPFMNGIFLLNKIKEANENTLVILITGYAHFKQLVARNNHKPDGFLTKPFDLHKIFDMVTKLAKECGLMN
ncbi:hypothetical protein CEE37_02250 [candidate division LCP-89 bacterium B3_LCP]|uniref:Response regulatory domain-containing protein n=1 Tax=candidate division LCP-89 bacterium B3_LCP TaxID=2012998 RepID=A0A532V5Q9_UNCL8|nr:MAG: hypothetical protein CEE37_02250 [candidate division LCP-89 bacterium B3_LCP]